MVARFAAHFAMKFRIAEKPETGPRHFGHVADLTEVTVFLVRYNFWNSADTARNHWYLTGHCLQRNQSKRLAFTGQQKHVGHIEELRHIVLLAEKEHIIGNSVGTGQPLGFRPLRAITDHEQFGALPFPDLREYGDYILHSFYRTKVGNMNEDSFIGRSEPIASVSVLGPVVETAIDEIGNNSNR